MKLFCVIFRLRNPLANFFFRQGDRRFVLLRGGTPINMDRELPTRTIQLTRAMLFAGCLQALGEKSPGWKVFAEQTQRQIEADWLKVQQEP